MACQFLLIESMYASTSTLLICRIKCGVRRLSTYLNSSSCSSMGFENSIQNSLRLFTGTEWDQHSNADSAIRSQQSCPQCSPQHNTERETLIFSAIIFQSCLWAKWIRGGDRSKWCLLTIRCMISAVTIVVDHVHDSHIFLLSWQTLNSTFYATFKPKVQDVSQLVNVTGLILKEFNTTFA